ncbi:MAG: endopeptidase La [Pseudomonadales bacterium]|jgi:ATP-dependent Lon protease|nr:endopeptidase La [Pseudomonadales bacterium]
MDIEHDSGESLGEAGRSENRGIILPRDALPGVIHVLPQETRPIFPGQGFPLLMNAELWQPTLEAVRERGHNVIGVIATRGAVEERPTAADLHEMGTACRIHRVHRDEDQLHVLLEGVQRFSVRRWLSSTLPLAAQVRYHPERAEAPPEHVDEVRAYAVAIINTIKELVPLNPLYGEELKVFLARSNPNEPAMLADFAASLTTSSRDELQEVLETLPLLPRLERVLALLQREVGIARTQQEIRAHVEAEISTNQRQALLREQLKFIQRELGITKDDRTAEIDEFRERLAQKTPTQAAAKRIEEELDRLAMLESGSPEYGVVRNWLEWATDLPWGVTSEDSKDLESAARRLDASHDGLDDIKERILEFLGLGLMKGDVGGSILLFVGPPGVGKTSLGRAIADAVDRRFYRFSVGGMRDEAEIKGYRRTYVGALPGKLIRALREAGTANPVIMLDEIDKIGASYQGDPASALLEVLDPEQNANFHDHYLDLDVDLSKTLFVCTANQLDTIPPPLLDRMEVIHLSGYLADEKLEIARNHLLPRQLERAGLKKNQLRVHKAALRKIVDGYAREAGVRRLDKQLGTVVRKAVMKLLRGEVAPVTVRSEDVEAYLGQPLFREESRLQGVGVVTGLAWTAMGGATLPVEVSRVHGGTRGLKLTGQLGEVMRESAQIALDHVAAEGRRYSADPAFFEDAMLHVHVPAGATPKDGPSAGITMATALVSLATGRRPKRDLAMTGELTLTGQVYPVGGIREKLIAARRLGVRTVLLPDANRRDVDEIPAHVVAGLDIHYVSTFTEVVELAFR